MNVLTSGARLELTYPSGDVVSVTFAESGQYTTSTGSSGSWVITGDTLCTQKSGAAAQTCGTLPAGMAVGDNWETGDLSGNMLSVSIVQ